MLLCATNTEDFGYLFLKRLFFTFGLIKKKKKKEKQLDKHDKQKTYAIFKTKFGSLDVLYIIDSTQSFKREILYLCIL